MICDPCYYQLMQFLQLLDDNRKNYRRFYYIWWLAWLRRPSSSLELNRSFFVVSSCRWGSLNWLTRLSLISISIWKPPSVGDNNLLRGAEASRMDGPTREFGMERANRVTRVLCFTAVTSLLWKVTESGHCEVHTVFVTWIHQNIEHKHFNRVRGVAWILQVSNFLVFDMGPTCYCIVGAYRPVLSTWGQNKLWSQFAK